MSREFTLVLLGAGLLTAGYFLWPEQDPVEKAEKAAGGRAGGASAAHVHVIPILAPGQSSSPALVQRGGFGRSGALSGG